MIADPPYGTGANNIAARLQSSAAKYQQTGTKNKLPAFAGDSMLPDAWRSMMRGVLVQCDRILKPGGDALLFCDWRSMHEMIGVAGSVGLGIRTVAVWDKNNSRPSKNGFRPQSEFIIHARKAGKLDRNRAVYLPGVFRHTTRFNNKRHVTEKPLGLMLDLMKIAPEGGTVCDPFQGSGTTGEAAIRTGRNYLGVELTAHYHAVAVERLEAAQSEPAQI
ncbi:DNA-methyltransferase [Roseiconus lacunae]|uniref:Methyltransferase n=1 Tax=Roseiconus lacunae TaxID=2605694 RepID=A0ABT7PI41_9BACT|nr:site-specific DNA-methyltransferase [Roseiconus lacunae]MDM4015964.1 site-specific DNA-methyltransferase [Roseiconus lacunae]